jgi:hypothetical protein
MWKEKLEGEGMWREKLEGEERKTTGREGRWGAAGCRGERANRLKGEIPCEWREGEVEWGRRRRRKEQIESRLWIEGERREEKGERGRERERVSSAALSTTA